MSKRPRVEMIPLIDMFFLLLVFFIFGVFSMTMQQGISVELPSARTTAAGHADRVTVSVTAEGALFVQGEPIDLEGLEAALRRAHAKRADQVVAIQADRRTSHGTVVAVLDAVRRAGLSHVSFEATEESGR